MTTHTTLFVIDDLACSHSYSCYCYCYCYWRSRFFFFFLAWAQQQWEKQARQQQQQQQQSYYNQQQQQQQQQQYYQQQNWQQQQQQQRPEAKKDDEFKWPFNPNDPYSVLGIDRYATDAKVSNAFRKEMLQYHPDTQPNVSEAQKRRSVERCKLITEAYRTIKTERKAKKQR